MEELCLDGLKPDHMTGVCRELYDLLSEDLTERQAIDAVVEMCRRYGGLSIYFKPVKSELRAYRDECIRAEFNGSNTAQLARKYGLIAKSVEFVLKMPQPQPVVKPATGEEPGKPERAYGMVLNGLAPDHLSGQCRELCDMFSEHLPPHKSALLAARMCDYYNGQFEYIPRFEHMLKPYRNECLRAEFNGRNLRALALKYGLTETHARELLKKKPVAKPTTDTVTKSVPT